MATRIPLCGRLVATIDGERVEQALAGGQARLLFAYLVLHNEPAHRSGPSQAVAHSSCACAHKAT